MAQLNSITNGIRLIDAQNRLYTFDSSNNILVHDDNGVLLYTFSAIIPTSEAGSNDYGGLFLDDRSNLYVTSGSRIDIFAPTTNVTGKIALDGVSSLSSTAIPLDNLVVQFRASGATNALFTRTVPITPDAANSGTGKYLIDNVPPGTYDIAFKTAKSLQFVAKSVPVSGVGYGPDILLVGGDANNDNTVDIGDFGILVNAYGSDKTVMGSGYDPAADFNGDGRIDIEDFGILVNNYNLSGDP